MAQGVQHNRIAWHGPPSSALAAISVYESDEDLPAVLVPRLETQIVVRLGAAARGGLDAHALGGRHHVHRKPIRSGQRILVARLRLGMHQAILGVPASAIAGHAIALEALWGDAASRLFDRFVDAHDLVDAAAALERSISERLAIAGAPDDHARFAMAAAERLQTASVGVVAEELGVSTRHLRRVFREALGTSPKAYARVTRFHRALRMAREEAHGGWASVAAAVGYYDQAHLIADFREIAGVTPRVLVDELRAGPQIG
jgi:AraC-like DNA-binding protein